MSKVYIFMKDIDTSQMASDRREAASPTGKWPYYDKSFGMTFESPAHKRRHLIPAGMRETGELVNPNKPISGRPKTRPDPKRAAIDAYIQSQGWAEGLLRKLRGG